MTSDANWTRSVRVASALACAVALAACADGGDAATGDGGVTFAAAVHPLLLSGCQNCHAAGKEAGDTQLLFTGDAAADHATVTMFVDTQAPAGSRLLAKMSGNGHQGGTVYAAGSPEYQTVLHWIEQGAQP